MFKVRLKVGFGVLAVQEEGFRNWICLVFRSMFTVNNSLSDFERTVLKIDIHSDSEIDGQKFTYF